MLAQFNLFETLVWILALTGIYTILSNLFQGVDRLFCFFESRKASKQSLPDKQEADFAKQVAQYEDVFLVLEASDNNDWDYYYVNDLFASNRARLKLQKIATVYRNDTPDTFHYRLSFGLDPEIVLDGPAFQPRLECLFMRLLEPLEQKKEAARQNVIAEILQKLSPELTSLPAEK